jgi:hypothetical protein
MPHSFASYTETSVNALKFNPKNQEVIEKKEEILRSIAEHHGAIPTSVLFIGFSPLILAATYKQIAVTEITQSTKKYLDSAGVKYVYIDPTDIAEYNKQFNWVIASDEYFTFAGSEQEQLIKIQSAANLAKDVIVTTLRDYKNQDFRDREFSQPLAVRNGKESKLFLEYHDYDYNDRNAWKSLVYEMQGNNVISAGPFSRRSMYFKQMAKFSIDAGAKTFYVHKNLMYKSLIKKNYEHVISISF